jgi:L-ascorbate 6-phosphate lactonase
MGETWVRACRVPDPGQNSVSTRAGVGRFTPLPSRRESMSTSDWGDWLPKAVASADPETVAVWYLGCNGFVMKGTDGTTLFVDPYVGLGDPPRTVRMIPVPFDPTDVEAADAVFATHEHTDHVHGPSQAPILAGTGCSLYAPDDSLAVAREDEAWTESYDVHDDQFVEVTERDSQTVGEFDVHVEPANDPDATHPVTYVFEHPSGTIVHCGDSKPGEMFADIGDRYDVDVAIVAFGSVGMVEDADTGEATRTKWYCDENEAVQVAEDLGADRLLPSHWDMWKGLTADPTGLHAHAASFESPRRLEIVEIGDRVDL